MVLPNEDFSNYNGEGTVLRSAQLRMLEILIEVDHICRDHNIPYWLDYGTLLGAVRHGGFIPWDDDLDISVLMKDFYKLKVLLQKELSDNRAYQDWKNEKKLTLKCAKVRDLHSFFDDGVAKKGEMRLQGIYIDIFPVEEVGSIFLKRKLDFLAGRVFRRMRGIRTGKLDKVLAYLIWPFVKMGEGVAWIVQKIRPMKVVGNIYGGLNIQVFHPKSDIFPLSEISFEGYQFSVPANTHACLQRIYGDYMQIPPKDKRMVHASTIEIYD